jgi:hypothetical protein
MTFTSLYKYAFKRSALTWLLSTTIVIRDIPFFSVWPTVNDSILNARRLKSDATLVSTPGLSSTKTEIV